MEVASFLPPVPGQRRRRPARLSARNPGLESKFQRNRNTQLIEENHPRDLYESTVIAKPLLLGAFLRMAWMEDE